ncbi:unnamed protein product [Brachionus calyciflorus]|uniref:Transposase domain-containing protein n=1 Tax=Brachionus calyciflorus TaxID=104777 RepID=A0A814N8S2_9BILA|nr:unnamed protein product [Brachionus calyciflorus]
MSLEFRRAYLRLNTQKPIPKSSKKLFEFYHNNANEEQNPVHNQIHNYTDSTCIEILINSNENSVEENIIEIEPVIYNENLIDRVMNGDYENDNDEEYREFSEKEKICRVLFKLYIKHKMKKSCINEFISFFRILFPGLNIPSNIDKIIETLSKKEDEIKYDLYNYCHNCSKSYKCDKSYINNCKICQNKVSKFFHVNILSQLRRILGKNLKLISQENSEIYKIIQENEKGKFFTFTLNTDGISPFKSSKTSIWPVYLVINEINLNDRFKFSNMILAGLWHGSQKPDFFNFMKPIVEEPESLEKGEIVKIDSNLEIINFFLIFSVLDKPARSALLNMKQFNGFFGCLKCYQKGESLETNKNGSIRVYPYQPYKFKGPLRNHNTYYKDLLGSIDSKKVIRGVKGACVLDSLKYYFPVESTMIDYMHSVLEGVMKKLLEYWYDSEFSDKDFSLRKYRDQINIILVSIKVPRFIPRLPRDICDLKFWKANELLSFLIFYSLPILRGFMDLNQYMHLINLVVAVENLLKKDLNISDLNNIETLFRDFVRDMANIYGPKSMLSGVHELLHIVDDVKKIGNLNEFNCFPFENFNRESLNLVNSKNPVAVELINSFRALKILNNQPSFFNDNGIFSEIKKDHEQSPKFKFSKALFIKIPDIVSDKIKNIDICEHFFVSSYLKFKNNFFSSLCYKETKRLDYCVKLKNLYGLINFFIHDKEKFYAVCSVLSFFHSPFYNKKFPDLVSETKICGLTESYFIAPFDKLKKCLCIKANDVYYVSQLDISHLFL